MDDKELVEVWRKEFIDLSRLGSVAAIYEMDRFLNREVELRWQGFLLAKRSQPSVVLPEYIMCDDQKWIEPSEMMDNLTAAGIKYTIGE